MYLQYYNRYSTIVQVIIHNSAKLSIEKFKDRQVKHEQLSIWLTSWFKFSFILEDQTSVADLAETSLSSPRKLFIFIVKNLFYRIKV